MDGCSRAERRRRAAREGRRMSGKGDLVMTTQHGGHRVIVAAVALALVCSWITPALAQAPPGDFASVVSAARAWPGCLGVETGQTSSGKRVIFAWFESKKALVGWYHSEVHQKAMKTAFPNQTFDREPLPDTPEDSGPILAIVSLSFSTLRGPARHPWPLPRSGSSSTRPCPGAWRSADGSPPMLSRCGGCGRSSWGRRRVDLADGNLRGEELRRGAVHQLPAGRVCGESGGGGLRGLEDLVRLEQVEGVVHDLHELHRPGLVDDEIGPLRIAEHRALLIGLHRAVRGEHLTPGIGEEELLAALILLPRGEGEVMVSADAHDLGTQR